MELVARIQICVGPNHSPIINKLKVVNLGRIKGHFDSPFWRIWDGSCCSGQTLIGAPGLGKVADLQTTSRVRVILVLLASLRGYRDILLESLPWRSQESHTHTYPQEEEELTGPFPH